jgi:hypothetical protein
MAEQKRNVDLIQFPPMRSCLVYARLLPGLQETAAAKA